MKTFKQYIQEKLTLSVVEAIQIKDVGEAVASMCVFEKRPHVVKPPTGVGV